MKRTSKAPIIKTLFLNTRDNMCDGVENISIIVHKRRLHHRRKSKRTNEASKQIMGVPLMNNIVKNSSSKLSKRSSMPEFTKGYKEVKSEGSTSETAVHKSHNPYSSKFFVNVVSEFRQAECLNPFNNPLANVKWRVYRCQLSTQDDSCCCSCNSDAMFEVMKSLYDCYKKKNCDHCNCILCGHLPREERKLGELRKSGAGLATIGVGTEKEKAELAKKTKKAEKELVGKSPAEKEKILRELAMSGAPLPEPKTASEKEIMKKVRAELPVAEREKLKKAETAKLIVPLEGKTAAEKEKILLEQAKAGIPLPEGKTASEKAIIQKVKAAVGLPSKGVPSEKIRKAKAAGFLTPLEGKTPEQKEKILKGLAMSGVPLPEAKTASEKKLIDKVRTEVGLPPEPKSLADKKKYQKALASGIITPLEGKSKAQKEKILKSQAEAGLPLPEGRTPSEKALIAKIKSEAPSAARIPSEKLRKAKEAGLLTPLAGKTPEQKEKILKGLAMSGVPLPEAKTASEKKLIDKVRTEVGLPPEPKSLADKKKYQKALASGIITPLEGKSKAQKEKILKSQAEAGLPLPEGRTPSEKALIAKVKATTKPPSEGAPSIKASPSEKLKKAKAAGLITPLEGKSPEQKEKILRGLAMQGIPLPEGKTASEKKLIDKVREDVGLPPEPKAPADKEKYKKAIESGAIIPLEGKTPAQKEKILKAQLEAGLPLPEGRTASEKALVQKVKAEAGEKKRTKSKSIGAGAPALPPDKARKLDEKTAKVMKEGKGPSDECICGLLTPESDRVPVGKAAMKSAGAPSVTKIPSEKLRKAKAAGLLTPLAGKSPEQREKIIKGLAKAGLPLPEAKTASEKKIVDKVRAELGIPPEPKTPSMKQKYARAQAQGIMTPLEGKTPAQKEKILKSQAEAGIPLPEGRTPSEKALIAKVKAEAPSAARIPSEKLRKAKAAGFLTPLEGKTPEQKEKILKGLAMSGVPLPEAKTASEKKLIDKVRTEVGLPPEPKSLADKKKYQKALASGIITPLEGKSKAQKEKILKSQAEAGLPLPEGRTPSEKALIAKIKSEAPSAARIPSEKLRKAKEAGLLTPLAGKTPEQKEKILKGLAMSGVPLPEAKTASEKKLIDKVRTEVGLPPEPKSLADKKKYQKALASGIITPLEGKSKAQKEKILKSQAEAGLPLPEGRTPSEKALIAKVKATTKPPSEGAPSIKASPSEKLKKAKAAGLITPLEGKSPEQKEKILRGLAMQGIPLPEGKTASEKKLIDKVREDVGLPPEPKAPADKEKYKKAIESGAIIPLEGKTPAQKEKILKAQLDAGLPLPEGRTASEKALVQKVKAEARERKRTKSKSIGAGAPALPPDKARKLDEKTAKVMKEGKGPSDECICGLLTPESDRFPVGKAAMKSAGAPSVTKIPSEKLRKAKAAGLLTPLAGKSPEQREKIIKGLAKAGLPLPEAKTASEKKIVDKVRAELGIPPEPKTPSMKQKYARAQAQGIMTPLEGKTPAQKEKILKSQAEAGIPLPEGRTPSEKALIAKVKAEAPSAARIPSEKLRKAKAAGFLTPLEGKTPEQKEKILKGLAMSGVPLPEAKTASEKKLIDKVRTEVGLPPEPKSLADKKKYQKALASGIITPLEGKSKAQKEKILKSQAEAGLPLPEGRTPSEKALIAKIKSEAPSAARIPSEKLRKAKEAGLLTPLSGKSPEQKEKILKGLAKAGLPLPEGKTASEKKMADKVRTELGIPPEPKTPSMKQKYARAQTQGIMTPLEGKTPAQKEKILKSQAEAGIPLPEGRTPSEKALISKVRATTVPKIPSEKLREAKAAGLLTPLEGKSKDQKEKIIKGLVKAHLPLPEGKTPSDKELIRKVREDMRLPPEPKTPSIKEKYQKALAAGIITPLEGKTPAQKEKILKQLKEAGIPLPEGKTASEKSIIRKVKAAPSKVKVPSEKLLAAKAAGLLTPLEGKTPAQKEKILKGLAQAGIPLPEGKTASEKALISKTKAELGIKPSKKRTPTPLSKEAQELDKKTTKFMTEGKGPSDECICDILTPESEKFPVGKAASKLSERVPSEKLRKAKAAGLLTPLEGKSAPQKEKILKGLAEAGIPLPEGKTPSEKALVQKVKTEYGIPKAVTPSEKEIVRKAKAEGLMTPLAGKTAAQKEKTLKGLVEAGLPLPEGKTPSEKQLIQKVRTAAGLPAEATPSEKLGKIRKKSKKVGAAASKRISKGIGGTGVSKAGIAEEIQDITKTTMCDRGCGCDKKKIRFKHSYVKIRVTSPDISSFCPCPNECIPGVKGGVFVDNEGIKVTVGSAVGFPKFSIEKESKISFDDESSLATYTSEINHNISQNEINSISEKYFKREKDFKIAYKNINMNANYSNESLSIIEGQNNIYKDNIQNYCVNDIKSDKDIKDDTSTSRYLIACSESFSTSNTESRNAFQDTFCEKSSLNSMLVKTESSLSFSTKPSASIRTISIISFHNSSIVSTSSHYLCYECSRSATSISAEDSEHFTNVIDYSTVDSLASDSKEVFKYSVPVEAVISDNKSPNKIETTNNAHIYRISQTNLRCIKDPRKPRDDNKHDPIIVINDLNSDEDILKIISEVLAKKDNIASTSSIYVVVPTSDEYDTDLSECVSSTICIRLSENFFDWKNVNNNVNSTQKRKSSKKASQGLKITAKGKQLFLGYTPTNSKFLNQLNQNHSAQTAFELSTQNQQCQVNNIIEFSKNREVHLRAFNMDTTQDRPCCCLPNELDSPNNHGSKEQFVANAFSEIMVPMFLKQGDTKGFSQDAYREVQRLDLTDFKAKFSNQSTSISVCEVPPCSDNYPYCHASDKTPIPQKSLGTQSSQYPGLGGLTKILPIKSPCNCTARVTGRRFQSLPRHAQSVACGPNKCKDHNIPVPSSMGEKYPCSNCGRPTMRDGKNMSCLCSGEEINFQLPNLCPCEGHKPSVSTASTGIEPQTGDHQHKTRPVGDQSCLCDDKAPISSKEKTCTCSGDSKGGKTKKKKNNIICECPQIVEEEPDINLMQDIFDPKADRKMKSDQTQTTSGFRINFKKRPNLAEEMSFEDAIKYFDEHPEEGGGTQVDDSCFCYEPGGPSPSDPNVKCECPYEPPEEPVIVAEEPLPGLKLHITAKGSGSKGLSGICCFDMVQASNGLMLLHD